MATGAAPEAPKPPPAPAGVSVIAQADPNQLRKLSEEFALILKEFEVETVTLREVLVLLQGRGYVLLVMLLALPFCQPIPLPGLSTPLGLIIGIIGARLALGQKPWLPARLLDTRLPPKLFARVFELTQKIVRWFERLLRPRLLWVTSTPRRRQLHAIPIVVCALLLLLPLPLPFSNVIPAWGVLLIAGGLLERDGKFIIAGYVATLASLVYFALSGSALWYAAQKAYEKMLGWFQ
ncbi:MAG: exopolysaccharide biosynthesis protein [Opitutaceae bacterium]|nr:exopolysaccharide biosynthesis protein [Opitutaceae bacterium]